LGENTQGTEKDIPFGVHTFNAWTVYSRIVRVPVQLLQDAFSAGGFKLEKFLSERLGTRIGRTENLAYTTGDGSSKPEGIISSSGTTHIRSAAGDDTLALNDFVDLETHVDSAYRTGAIYMFNDTSLGIIKKVALAASNAFLWQPSFRDGAPSLINGYKYVINNDMASPASGAKSVLFGDFSQYVIRDALGVTLLTLKERYADYLQVGFIAYARTDGAYLAAGSRDIAVLRNITT
jgi:HK97 family phage major capsid protein